MFHVDLNDVLGQKCITKGNFKLLMAILPQEGKEVVAQSFENNCNKKDWKVISTL
jgi:hypothetical protein